MKDLYYVAQEILKQKNLKGNLLKICENRDGFYVYRTCIHEAVHELLYRL